MEFKQEHEDLLISIHKALIGDEFHPDGLMCEHKELKKRVDTHDTKFKILSGVVVILAGLISAIGTIFSIYK